MISKLPRWVWTGTWALAFIAGSVNAVGFLGFDHIAITNLTGTTTLLGTAVGDADTTDTLHFAMLIAAFVAGCSASGYIIQDSALKLGRRYGIALLLVSALLFAAIPLLGHHNVCGMYLAALACGLQNAMVSTYSGAVVRTTHVSGMFTDLGIFLGHYLRRLPVDNRRLRLSVTVISGFLCGGIAGAVAFRHLDYFALVLPATLTALTSLTYAVYHFRHLRT